MCLSYHVSSVKVMSSSIGHQNVIISPDNCVFVSHSSSVPIDVCHVRYLNVLLSFCCHCHVLQQQLTITQRWQQQLKGGEEGLSWCLSFSFPTFFLYSPTNHDNHIKTWNKIGEMHIAEMIGMEREKQFYPNPIQYNCNKEMTHLTDDEMNDEWHQLNL